MLIGFNIRQHIKVIASGKILSGWHMVRAVALAQTPATAPAP